MQRFYFTKDVFYQYIIAIANYIYLIISYIVSTQGLSRKGQRDI